MNGVRGVGYRAPGEVGRFAEDRRLCEEHPFAVGGPPLFVLGREKRYEEARCRKSLLAPVVQLVG